jgi:tetratricopeptide (TPR) repeat protein
LPESADAHNYYGFALAREGMLTESISEFRRAIQLDAKHAEAHYNLGCAFLAAGDTAAAVKPLEEAVALRNPFPEAHSALAMAVSSTGNLERAVGHLRLALQQRPDMTSAHNQLGMIFSRMGEDQQALSEFAAAVKSDPSSVESHNNLGVAFHKSGDLPRAIAEFEKAIRLDANSLEALRNLGQAMRDKGDLPQAIRCYERLSSLQPDSAQTRTDLGFTLKRADRLDEAIEQLSQATRLDPAFARAHFYLAEALSQKGDQARALVEFEQSRTLRPRDVEYAVKYGVALQQTNLPGAIAELRRAVQLDEKNPAAQQALGQALRRAGEAQEAAPAFDAARKLNATLDSRSQAVLHTNKGIEQLKAGNIATAEDAFRKALAIDPKFAAANHLPWELPSSATGKWAEANRAFDAALEPIMQMETFISTTVLPGKAARVAARLRAISRDATSEAHSHPRAGCELGAVLTRLGEDEGGSASSRKGQRSRFDARFQPPG